MSTALKLPPKLDLSAATQLVSDLRAIEGDMHIDASEVTHMGSLCLQALIAAARHANASDNIFEISNFTQRALDQLSVMGVTPENLMEGVQ